MIRYFLDIEKQYKEDLLLHLRTHNDPYVLDKTDDSKFVYVYEEDELIGFVYTSYGWNWVSFDKLYYTSINGLKALISETVKLFKDRASGYKMYSNDQERSSDLMQVGFKKVGTMPGTKRTGDFTCLNVLDLGYEFEHTFEVKIYDKELETHEDLISTYVNEYELKNKLDVLQEEVLYVGLEENEYCGGVLFKVYQEYVHVHLISVKNEYKRYGIGTALMKFAEEYAVKLGLESIDLGTTEFQARPFYEKLGYEVVFARENYPIGYKCYTLYKKL